MENFKATEQQTAMDEILAMAMMEEKILDMDSGFIRRVPGGVVITEKMDNEDASFISSVFVPIARAIVFTPAESWEVNQRLLQVCQTQIQAAGPGHVKKNETTAGPVDIEPIEIGSDKYHVTAAGLTNRITGKAIPKDEPVFVLVGHDVNAVQTLEEYLGYFVNYMDGDDLSREAVSHKIEGQIDKFREFAKECPTLMRLPNSDEASGEGSK